MPAVNVTASAVEIQAGSIGSLTDRRNTSGSIAASVIRMTADGHLRTCLFAHTETDLRAVVRSGEDDAALAQVIRRAVWHKELKHYIGDKRFRRTARSMSMIGG